jgi:hypothetical protein
MLATRSNAAEPILVIPVMEEAKSNRRYRKPKTIRIEKKDKPSFSLGSASLTMTCVVVLLAFLCMCLYGDNALEPTSTTAPFEINQTTRIPSVRPEGDMMEDGVVEVTFTTKNGSCRVAHLPRDKKFLKVDSEGPTLSINDLLRDETKIPTKMALPTNLKSYPCSSQAKGMR